MYKKTIFLTTLTGFFLLIISCVVAKPYLSSIDYKSEQILLCPTFEEMEQNPELSNLGCACGSDLFSKEDMDTAVEFLKKIKYAVKENDTDYIVNAFTYPLTIESSTKTYTINTPEDFYMRNFNLSKLLPIPPNERLFWNYQGFMYSGLRFYVKDNKIIELKIITN